MLDSVTSMLVLVGVLFMGAAIVQGWKVRDRVPPELRGRWRAVVGLMLFFLAGYLLLVTILSLHYGLPTEIVTGPVFLAGAVFVFIVIRLTRHTIGKIRSAEDKLRLLNESLEQRVADRTQEVNRSQEFLRTVLDSLNDDIAIIDINTFKIVDANASFLKEYGYTHADIINRTCYEVTHNRAEVCAPPRDVCPLLESMRTGGFATEEHVHFDRSGKEIYAEVSSSPIRDKDGGVTRVVHVSRDITERKKAEEALKRSEARFHGLSEQLAQSNRDLHEINEELKSFAYIVSHDLRAPLVNIRGFSEELDHGLKELGPLLGQALEGYPGKERKKFEDVVNKDIPEALGFIASSVTRMDNLISAILNLSRAGRRKLNPVPVRTGELVRKILETLAHQVESRGITVEVGELADLVADRTAMEQIFGNLLDNAVKYLEPARPGKIEIGSDRIGHEIVFHVRDNGRGMADEDIPKAFEIFRRVGRQDVPGEGMGLAYVRALVRHLGGRIWCESTPGVGTTFSFSLPAAAEVVEQTRTGGQP